MPAYFPLSPLSEIPQPAPVEPIQLKRFDVPAGNAGVGRTLTLMRALALGGDGAQNAQIRQLASHILVSRRVPARDESAEARAMSDWVQATIRFTGEHNPAVQESLQSPKVTLQMRTGDCDDFATLLSALLHSVGIQNRFKVVKPIGQESNPAAPWSHVYVIATNKRTGEQIMLDPTLDNPSGYQFSDIQANNGGAEFGLAGLRPSPSDAGRGHIAPAQRQCSRPGGLGCAGCKGTCKYGGGMSGLGDLNATIQSVLNSAPITALAQGEAIHYAYGNNASLTSLQQSTAANPFATPAQLGTLPGSAPALGVTPQIPAWLWFAGVGIGGIVLFTLAAKKR